MTLVEIDMDRCTLTWGVGACTAALGGKVVRKCFNTFATCKVPGKAPFASAPYTLRFCEARAGLPVGLGAIPILESVSQITATVNIAGSDEDMSALGRTATVTVKLRNVPHNDMGLDPYQAERITGAAQLDGIGYDPAASGTLLGRLKARWPHYSGRALRILEGRIEAGSFVVEQTRHYTLTDWVGPDDKAVVTLKAKDPMSALDDDKAVLPAPSPGVLAAAISDVAGSLTLAPTGAGAAYPASGRAKIGSELVNYTRAGDVMTLTARGVRGTKAAAHSVGDTVQDVLVVQAMRVDDLAEMLVRVRLPAALVPKATKWAPEVSRWAPSLKLTSDVCEPTGVKKLLAELAVLGVSIFWDDVAQEVALRVNRPVDADEIFDLTDAGHLLDASIAERNEKRLTEVLFFSVQLDPTKSAASADNFARVASIVDAEAMDARAFGDRKMRKIFCRWLNDGGDAIIGLVGRRLLRRLNTAPAHLVGGVSVKDRAVPLAAVARVTSGVIEDEVGRSPVRLMQVISREPSGAGGRVEYVLQAYQFAGRYGFATENARPTYPASNDAQQTRGMYACNPATLKMSNGDEPYLAI
ncbi:MAG: hypothetical protein U1E58_10205 [Tabrizicola sp.]